MVIVWYNKNSYTPWLQCSGGSHRAAGHLPAVQTAASWGNSPSTSGGSPSTAQDARAGCYGGRRLQRDCAPEGKPTIQYAAAVQQDTTRIRRSCSAHGTLACQLYAGERASGEDGWRNDTQRPLNRVKPSLTGRRAKSTDIGFLNAYDALHY